jgi:predicted ATPase
MLHCKIFEVSAMWPSDEMRHLETKWASKSSWPKWLDWIEIANIRGFVGQRIAFDFPIVAIVGENGSGKSTVLQSAACAYRNDAGGRTWYPTDFFPETAWDNTTNVEIRFSYREGATNPTRTGLIKKPTSRWLRQPTRPIRTVYYIGLERLQPVSTRVGYARIAKIKHVEKSHRDFSEAHLKRMCFIMGEEYDYVRMAISSADDNRAIPVMSKNHVVSSGFHHGMGELTAGEWINRNIDKYSLVVIDEIESSFHVRAQRRLIRDLATIAREKECQFIISTHSPTILDMLPIQARTYILRTKNERTIVTSVTPQFAMTKMDDEIHEDCEVFVEDERSKTWLTEIISRHAPDILFRINVIPYGSANLGAALGELVNNKRLLRPTVVFRDGDQGEAPGCWRLPGSDNPERVVFKRLKDNNWTELPERIGRTYADVSSGATRAMTSPHHKEWIPSLSNQLRYDPDNLWQHCCSEWARLASPDEVEAVIERIREALPTS